jgi:hypothetical protein
VTVETDGALCLPPLRGPKNYRKGAGPCRVSYGILSFKHPTIVLHRILPMTGNRDVLFMTEFHYQSDVSDVPFELMKS